MNIFPAIDLFGKKAVRLFKGDYNQMTVYSEDPAGVAAGFKASGAEYLHLVDLEGARDGNTPNLGTVKEIIARTDLFVEIGGGIRTEETVRTYLDAGAGRVILGTAALNDPEFLDRMLEKYKEKIAVGVDFRDGKVAVKGWRELSDVTCFDFCETLEKKGVSTVICTDISKDGLLGGTNIELYREMVKRFSMNLTASGGVSSLGDVEKLRDMGIYGAILGKALYTGMLDLGEAVRLVKEGSV
jgi:phosphoribosylformimino-5-aminoimidazole carboxamide ribotide isomerase